MTELKIDNLYDTYRWEEPPMPICEICGSEHEYNYIDQNNYIVGCEHCLDKVDALDN